MEKSDTSKVNGENLKNLELQRHICKQVENVIEEVIEVIKSRVEALEANCLIGCKIDINSFTQQL